MQLIYKNKINLFLIMYSKKKIINKIKNSNFWNFNFKYKILINKYFIYFLIINIILYFYSFNLIKNYSINNNVYFNYNFFIFF